MGADHFPEENIPDGRAGRKPIPTRRVLEAVLWIVNTGAQWHMQPNQKILSVIAPTTATRLTTACAKTASS
jgi:hypothetical protein